jgi:hypothetical protein
VWGGTKVSGMHLEEYNKFSRRVIGVPNDIATIDF